MRAAALFAAVFSTAICLALPAGAAGPKPDKNAYPVKVHVVASRVQYFDNHFHQVLYAYLDGQYEELSAFVSSYAVLQPGDYTARLVENDKHPNGHDVIQSYVLMFPDGTTRSYDVSAMGLPPGATSIPQQSNP